MKIMIFIVQLATFSDKISIDRAPVAAQSAVEMFAVYGMHYKVNNCTMVGHRIDHNRCTRINRITLSAHTVSRQVHRTVLQLCT